VKRFDAVIASDVMSMPGRKEASIARGLLFPQKTLITLRHQVKRFDHPLRGLLP
jgi:hypothetical protein